MNGNDQGPTNVDRSTPDGPSLETTGAYEPTNDRLVEILEEYMDQLKAGRMPNRSELLARYPEHAEQLEACLAGIEFLHAGAPSPAVPRQIGDFRLLREVGRGGMGAVFEAQQVSLGRRVAVKILHFAPASDSDAVDRFRREAETVAKLHHTSIVPIYSVGSESFVNYFVMQFIDGQSLAQALAESAQPFDPRQVAQWGLQAAEALDHAHRRGVVHRDVKPSNLLLDEEGRLWLTDFGLAKRVDDVSLSLSGGLLGTPRYMSPEQASSSRDAVDSRTDIYSLGATLFELVSGEPLFTGTTSHEVIQQILRDEPRSLRKLRPEVPVDLETVIEKCLAKDPGQRYASAAELAEDLRAFLDGRLVSARRATPWERAARWFQRQRSSVRLASTAVVATLLSVLSVAIAAYAYVQWRQGYLAISTTTPPVVTEVKRLGDDETLLRTTAPTQEELAFPAGEYLIKAAAPGRMEQQYQLRIDRAVKNQIDISFNDELSWANVSAELGCDFVQTPLGDRLLISSRSGVLCRDARRVLWSMTLGDGPQAQLNDLPALRWILRDEITQPLWEVRFPIQPKFCRQAADLDGDGVGDFVCGGARQAWLMALSGANGTVLWVVGRDEGLRDETFRVPEAKRNQYHEDPKLRSGNAFPPLMLGDVDGDGVTDYLATLIKDSESSATERWLEVFSGRTGTSIWRLDLDDGWFQLPPNTEVPNHLEWFAQVPHGVMGGFGGSSHGGTWKRRRQSSPKHYGDSLYMCDQPWLIELDPGSASPSASPTIAVLAGNRALMIEPSSGKLLTEAVELEFRPDSRMRLGDIDGDGRQEVIYVQDISDKRSSDSHQVRLVAWSPTTRSTIWSQQFKAAWPRRSLEEIHDRSWPLVRDLDHDGKVEIVLPQMEAPAGRRALFGDWAKSELLVLEGATGAIRWRRAIPSLDEQLDQFLVGPDVDGDKVDDLFVASIWGIPDQVFLDALSGSSGDSLWHAHRPISDGDGEFWLDSLQLWYGQGVETPFLLLQWRRPQDGGAGNALLISAVEGRVRASWSHVARLSPADLNQDSLEELLVWRQPSSYSRDRLLIDCVKGHSSEWWRRLATQLTPAADFNQDGIRDFVDAGPRGAYVAYSGRDGSRLWRSALPAHRGWSVVSAGREAMSRELPPDVRQGGDTRAGDLNRDGVVDLLLVHPTNFGSNVFEPLVTAVSGRTGRRLWDSETRIKSVGSVMLAQVVDLDGDGLEEIVCVGTSDIDYPDNAMVFGSHQVQLWLVVLEGWSGKERYKRPLGPQHGLNGAPAPPDVLALTNATYLIATSDLDGDKLPDVVVAAQGKDTGSWELLALQGAAGKELWRRPLSTTGQPGDPLVSAAPLMIGPVDAAGRRGVLSLAFEFTADQQNEARLIALDGATGQERWVWKQQVGEYVGRESKHSLGSELQPRITTVPLPQGVGYLLNLTSQTSPSQLVIVNQEGREVAQRQFEPWARMVRAWPVSRGGGRVGLVYLLKDKLECVDPLQLDRVLWSTSVARTAHEHLLRIADVWEREGRASTVLVQQGFDDNSVDGFDAGSGEVLWRCPGIVQYEDLSADGSTVHAMDGIHVWPTPDDVAPAMVAYQSGSKTVVRAVQAVEPKAFNSVATRNVARKVTDVRRLRPLPWRMNWRDESIVPAIAWAVLVSTLLVVIPVGYLSWLIRQRRFGLRTMMLLPLVTSLGLLGATWPAPAGTGFTMLQRIMAAVFWSPAVSAALILAWWTLSAQWRKAVGWCALSVAAAVVLALVILWILTPLWGVPLAEDERYSMQDWYLVWIPVAYVMSACLVVSYPAAWMFHAVRRVLARRPVGA